MPKLKKLKLKRSRLNSRKKKKKLMDTAIAETNEEREKLLEEARNEAAVLRSKLEKSLNAMQENLEHDIAKKTQEEVFAVARKTLKDLSSMSLELSLIHISEPTRRTPISYAVFCLKKK